MPRNWYGSGNVTISGGLGDVPVYKTCSWDRLLNMPDWLHFSSDFCTSPDLALVHRISITQQKIASKQISSCRISFSPSGSQSIAIQLLRKHASLRVPVFASFHSRHRFSGRDPKFVWYSNKSKQSGQPSDVSDAFVRWDSLSKSTMPVKRRIFELWWDEGVDTGKRLPREIDRPVRSRLCHWLPASNWRGKYS